MAKWFVYIGFLFFVANGVAQNETIVTKTYVLLLSPDYKIEYNALVDDPKVFHGPFKIYHNQKLLIKGYYYLNRKQGVWERYYPNGNLYLKGMFVHNKMHGDWQYYYPDKSKKATFHYNNQKRNETWKSYYPNGNQALEIFYGKDLAVKQIIHFYENERIAINVEPETIKGDTFITCARYYENNKIFEIQRFKNQLKHGIQQRFHANGLPWEELSFNNDTLVDYTNVFSVEGTKMVLGNFTAGNGTLKRYNYDGYLFSEINYKAGIEHGSFSYFDRAFPLLEGAYKSGQRIGQWNFYNKFHNKTHHITYYHQDTLPYCYYITAKASEHWEGALLNGLREGSWTEYNFFGEVANTFNYLYGHLHGNQSRFLGPLKKYSGEYCYGTKIGKWDYLNDYGKLVYSGSYADTVAVDTAIMHWNMKQIVLKNTTKNSFMKMWYMLPASTVIPANPIPTSQYPHPADFISFDPISGFENIDCEGFTALNDYIEILPKRKTQFTYKDQFEAPQFLGGNENFFSFIDANKIKIEAIDELKINGDVWVYLHINEIGEATDIHVVRGLGFGADQEAIRLFKLIPYWSPATINHLPVDCDMIIKIEFIGNPDDYSIAR